MSMKITQALDILGQLGLPEAQQNERSALSLLALVQLKKSGSWQNLEAPMLGIRAILDFCRETYRKPYAENTRESFRKETMHQFVSAGIAVQNPDDPDRAPNSPKWCYQISPEARTLLATYGTPNWVPALEAWRAQVEPLAERYRKLRDLHRVPCTLADGSVVHLAPGEHSELIRAIVEHFAPRFAPGSRVVYIGDTGQKGIVFDEARLASLGVTVHGAARCPTWCCTSRKRTGCFSWNP